MIEVLDIVQNTYRYIPHIEWYTSAFRITPERLRSSSKVAVPLPMLRWLLEQVAGAVDFDTEFYLSTNPDIAQAYEAGEIRDLRRHFIEHGYFEGRLGSLTTFDEAEYLALNPDVSDAVKRGDIASGKEHYMRVGYREGRIPSERVSESVAACHGAMRIK